MRIPERIKEKIRALCLEADVPHHKVLPYTEGFYSTISEDRVYSREIEQTAIDRIAELKGDEIINATTIIAIRDNAINDNKLMR